jgi:hypothetical protein
MGLVEVRHPCLYLVEGMADEFEAQALFEAALLVVDDALRIHFYSHPAASTILTVAIHGKTKL